MNNINDFLKTISEGKKERIKSSPGLSHIQNLARELSSENIFDSSVLKEEVIKEQQIPLEEDNNNNKVSKYISDNKASFQQPNPDIVDSDIAAIRYKLKFLEQAIGKIAAHGPGSGEVNFRYLDDVNRNTLTNSNDNWVLEYDANSKRIQTTNNIGPISSLRLDTLGPDIAQVTGMLNWNTSDDCLDVVQSGGTVCQVGLENYSQVYNATGSTLVAGTFVSFKEVYLNHVVRMVVEPFIADSTKRVLLTIGVITEDIAPGAMGRATKLGRVNDINTTGSNVGEVWAPGNELWAHPTIAGALTVNRPTAPNNAVFVGLVLKVHETSGVITVRYNPYTRMRYGSFYCISSQSTVPNTATQLCFKNIRINDGFLLGGTNPLGHNEITATRRGLYILSYSIQFTSTNSSTSLIWVWIQKNHVDVPLSASSWSIASNGGRLIATRSFFFTLLENDILSIQWAANSANILVDNPGSTSFAPDIPSIMIDIHQINL